MVSEVPDVRPPTQDGGQGGDELILDLHPHKVQLNQQQDVTYIQSSDCSSDSDDNEPSMGYDNALAVNPSGNDNNTPNVFVSDSSDVHVGTKNIYQGPVTIKKIVYAGNGGGEVPDVLQNGGALTNGTLKCDKDTSDSADIDNKTDKAGDKNENNLKAHISKLRYNKPLLITAIVCTLAIIGMIALLFLLLRGGNTSNRYPTDSDEQLGRPSVDPPLDPAELPPQRVKMILRREWLAQPPKQPLDNLTTPVPMVVIWHSATENCTDQSSCTLLVKSIQRFHMLSQNWWDIGYNFLVGGDGYVYEGRGWTSEGSHTKFYNKRSIGIAFVGTFTNYMPPQRQLNAARNLIALGVNESYIQPDYKLYASRQLSVTESPGQMLYEELITWPHWAETPKSRH